MNVTRQLTAPAGHVKWQDLSAAASDDLPDQSGRQVAVICHEGYCGVRLYQPRQSCPRASEDPERLVLPQEPRRPHSRAIRRDPGRKWLRQECVDVELFPATL